MESFLDEKVSFSAGGYYYKLLMEISTAITRASFLKDTEMMWIGVVEFYNNAYPMLDDKAIEEIEKRLNKIDQKMYFKKEMTDERPPFQKYVFYPKRKECIMEMNEVRRMIFKQLKDNRALVPLISYIDPNFGIGQGEDD